MWPARFKESIPALITHLPWKGEETGVQDLQGPDHFLNTFRRVNKRYHWICNGMYAQLFP